MQCPAPCAPLPAVVLFHISVICLCWRALLRHLVLVHLDPVRPACSDAHGLLDLGLCQGASCQAPEPGVGGQCPSLPLDLSDAWQHQGRWARGICCLSLLLTPFPLRGIPALTVPLAPEQRGPSYSPQRRDLRRLFSWVWGGCPGCRALLPSSGHMGSCVPWGPPAPSPQQVPQPSSLGCPTSLSKVGPCPRVGSHLTSHCSRSKGRGTMAHCHLAVFPWCVQP